VYVVTICWPPSARLLAPCPGLVQYLGQEKSVLGDWRLRMISGTSSGQLESSINTHDFFAPYPRVDGKAPKSIHAPATIRGPASHPSPYNLHSP